MANFGFTSRENPHETIYDGYIGKPVRIDVAGGIGGTGILSESNPHQGGHLLNLRPYIFTIKNDLWIISSEKVMINTSGSPVSVFPLGQTLEDFVKNLNSIKDKKSEKT